MTDVSLATEMFVLKLLVTKGPARPLRGWKSVRLYERMVEAGYAIETADESPFLRRFEITDAGRAVLNRNEQLGEVK